MCRAEFRDRREYSGTNISPNFSYFRCFAALPYDRYTIYRSIRTKGTYSDSHIIDDNINFFYGGWPGHYISVGYSKTNNGEYDFVTCNAGDGLCMSSEYTGSYDRDNCIVIYKSVSPTNLKKALTYATAYRNKGSGDVMGTLCLGMIENLLGGYTIRNTWSSTVKSLVRVGLRMLSTSYTMSRIKGGGMRVHSICLYMESHRK